MILEVRSIAYQVPANIQSLIDLKMAIGDYASQDQLLLKALRALDDYEQGVVDLKEAMEDDLAGRTISLADAEREISRELGFSA
jgi:hypothetical protein